MKTALNNKQHLRAILGLGLPLIGGHLAGFAIHLTDTIMLGWHSIEELAAVVISGSFWFTLFIVGAGFGHALLPLVSAAISRGEDTEVRRTTRMSMWLTLLFAAAVMPLMFFAEDILIAVGQKPQIAELSGTYLRIAGWSIFPALAGGVLRSYFAAQERTQFIFWTAVIGVALNAVFNYALIFGNWGAPEMGIIGAAWASVFVNTAIFVALAIYAYVVTPEHALFQRIWRPDWAAFVYVFKLGWPISLTSMAEVGLFTGGRCFGWSDRDT